MERIKFELERSDYEFLNEILMEKERELCLELPTISKVEFNNYDVLGSHMKTTAFKKLTDLQSLIANTTPNKYFYDEKVDP